MSQLTSETPCTRRTSSQLALAHSPRARLESACNRGAPASSQSKTSPRATSSQPTHELALPKTELAHLLTSSQLPRARYFGFRDLPQASSSQPPPRHELATSRRARKLQHTTENCVASSQTPVAVHYNITSLVTCLVTNQHLCNRLVTSLQAL